METLLRAGTIRSIKEVWRDGRPHPDFGTLEIRMFDGAPTLREIGMVAAPSQALVQPFGIQLDRLCRESELDVVSEVLDAGAPDERQRAIVEKGGDLADVVDALAAEFAGDRSVARGELAHGRI